MTRISVEYLGYLHPGRVKCLLHTEYMSMFIAMHILVEPYVWYASTMWMDVRTNVMYESLNILYSLVIFAFKNLSNSLFTVQIEIYEKNNIFN